MARTKLKKRHLLCKGFLIIIILFGYMHQFTILTNDNEGKCIKPGTNIWQNPQQKSKLKERSNSEHSQSSASFERMHKMPNLNNECKPGKKKKRKLKGLITVTIHYWYDHLTKQVIVKFCKQAPLDTWIYAQKFNISLQNLLYMYTRVSKR